MRELLANNAASIAIVVFGAIGAYFMLQAHDEQIKVLQEKIVEIEANKVSKSELALKETFAASEMEKIRTDIKHIDQRLDKKIRIINELDDELHLVLEANVNQEARLKETESELKGVWKFVNKFLEEL